MSLWRLNFPLDENSKVFVVIIASIKKFMFNQLIYQDFKESYLKRWFHWHLNLHSIKSFPYWQDQQTLNYSVVILGSIHSILMIEYSFDWYQKQTNFMETSFDFHYLCFISNFKLSFQLFPLLVNQLNLLMLQPYFNLLYYFTLF